MSATPQAVARAVEARFAHRRLTPPVIGLGIALLTGLYRLALASQPTNDDFLHLTLARQLLAGDWPVRDFFDGGLTLMYTLSALSQIVFGYRLAAEGVIVSAAFAVSTYLVFALVRRVTGSTLAAVLAAVLIPMAGPRGYSYPKVLVYAVAGWLWWHYVLRPERRALLWLGAWTAAAFYWRPDHGACVAAGVALAVAAAHGIGRAAVGAAARASAVTLALLIPFAALVAASIGLGPYVASGIALTEAQHVEMDTHALPMPPIRAWSDVLRLAPREAFAPVVSLRWTESSSTGARDALLARHDLTRVGAPDGQTQAVRLSRTAAADIRDLINEPIVEDTAGIDRATSSLPWSTWRIWERARFTLPWLRLEILPGLGERGRAGDATALLFYALPVLMILVAPLLAGVLPAGITAWRLRAFALFVIAADVVLLRTPYDVRAVDGVVLPAVLLGVSVTAVWRAASRRLGTWRWALRIVVIAVVVFTLKSVAVAGQFGEQTDWLAGEWRSFQRFRGTWSDVEARLAAEPPLTYWQRRGPASIDLAQYVSACVPQGERLGVLWFAPEIYYYADRLMGVRHLIFAPGWAALEDEQRLAVEKIERSSPPIVLARPDFATATREFYPGLVDYLEREYTIGGTFTHDDERFLVLTPRLRPATRSFGAQDLPCFR